MKNTQIKAFCFFISLLMSSCALYDGNITGNAALNNANYRYVGNVKASNRCVYVLHWGGNSKRSQVIALKEMLQKRYPLRNGLAWANVAVEMKTGFYVLWDVRRATISADIIDFWPDTNLAYKPYNGYYLNDSQFVYVPIAVITKDTDSNILLKKLRLMNANITNKQDKDLIRFESFEIKEELEVLFFVRRKLTLGIVDRVESNYFVIAYLNEFGNLKYKSVFHDDSLFKY